LFYLLSNWDFINIASISNKGARPRADWNYLSKVKLNIPPLPEQKAIASVFSSLDDKIDLLHRENKTLEAMANVLFKRYFIDNPNPDWRQQPLTVVSQFLNGLPCQKYPPFNNIERLPVLKIRELNNGISNDSDYATSRIKNDYIVKSGDIIFSWSGTLLVKIWFGENCILNQHIYKVTSKCYHH
jgi:type I restriction enzyme S subunit